MKYKIKHLWINIKLYANLPHFWILGIILTLSIIVCIISVMCIENKPFLSSMFANIFAGLVTGVVISLISAIKSVTLYRTECLIKWLDSLHKDIMEYIGMYQKMVFKNKNDFDDETFSNHIYETLCCGNNVNVKISQGRFNRSLPFDTYQYMKKSLNMML